jgi:hypothetical protein
MRHEFLEKEFPMIKVNDIVAVEHDWVKTFVLLPHRTVSNKWVWFKQVYCRRVWIYTGFVDEPVTQYGDLFDLLKE